MVRARFLHRWPLQEEAIKAWRIRLLVVGGVAALVSLAFLLVKGGPGHILRAYLMGFMVSFGFAGGGLAMLMLQYVSGGSGAASALSTRSSLARTLWLVAAMVVPILFFHEAPLSMGGLPGCPGYRCSVCQSA